jgi:hypothetical protein
MSEDKNKVSDSESLIDDKKKILQNIADQNLPINEFDLSDYVFKINKKFGGDISNHYAIKSIIEF